MFCAAAFRKIDPGFCPDSVRLLVGEYYGIGGFCEPILSAPALALCILMQV